MLYITLHKYVVCSITAVRIFTPSEKLQKIYAGMGGKIMSFISSITVSIWCKWYKEKMYTLQLQICNTNIYASNENNVVMFPSSHHNKHCFVILFFDGLPVPEIVQIKDKPRSTCKTIKSIVFYETCYKTFSTSSTRT